MQRYSVCTEIEKSLGVIYVVLYQYFYLVLPTMT